MKLDISSIRTSNPQLLSGCDADEGTRGHKLSHSESMPIGDFFTLHRYMSSNTVHLFGYPTLLASDDFVLVMRVECAIRLILVVALCLEGRAKIWNAWGFRGVNHPEAKCREALEQLTVDIVLYGVIQIIFALGCLLVGAASNRGHILSQEGREHFGVVLHIFVILSVMEMGFMIVETVQIQTANDANICSDSLPMWTPVIQTLFHSFNFIVCFVCIWFTSVKILELRAFMKISKSNSR